MNRRRVVRNLRYAVYALVAASLLYLNRRFDLTRLPEEGCSPLRAIASGARLVVDLHASRLAPGDAVLFRDPQGEFLLGQVGELPPSSPQRYFAAVEAGALWIVADNPRCPATDSHRLGPIGRDAIVGKVFLSF